MKIHSISLVHPDTIDIPPFLPSFLPTWDGGAPCSVHANPSTGIQLPGK